MVGEGCEVSETSEALRFVCLRGFEGAGASAARGSSSGAGECAAPTSPAMGAGAADGAGDAAARRRALAMRL